MTVKSVVSNNCYNDDDVVLSLLRMMIIKLMNTVNNSLTTNMIVSL